MYQVYILYSPNYDKIYIGCTGNLAERLRSHNELGKKGWTIGFRPWVLVHQETYPGKKEALLREKQLKGGQGRDWIRNEIISRL
ncbi:GIY-YIG nuclease family protein [Sediminibacterium soli]|uniref:GIY-YIG nuclease family protein n=1 Tax=Sediminibacterium soli TaxID=2698829 RepID=UPI00137AC890|nr:GIY-YIG nuclease family protein [Sediminibacterium soli]NCI46891.1 GIY-YIG nuclease family protein [Sediminibacterium soli]